MWLCDFAREVRHRREANTLTIKRTTHGTRNAYDIANDTPRKHCIARAPTMIGCVQVVRAAMVSIWFGLAKSLLFAVLGLSGCWSCCCVGWGWTHVLVWMSSRVQQPSWGCFGAHGLYGQRFAGGASCLVVTTGRGRTRNPMGMVRCLSHIVDVCAHGCQRHIFLSSSTMVRNATTSARSTMARHGCIQHHRAPTLPHLPMDNVRRLSPTYVCWGRRCLAITI